MRIVDLRPDDVTAVQQAAALLVESFAEHWPRAWPDLDAALREVHESFGEDRLSRVALDDQGAILGWVGGICMYDGNVWVLHPLVVSPRHRRQGIGRALVADLEARVRERGGLTLWLGTDDQNDQTTLSGLDLYPDVLGHLSRIRNLRGHPYEFYLKLGFTIVGVLPDANGPGRPDIYMARRVMTRPGGDEEYLAQDAGQ